jgi:hypothetical protein
MADKDAAAMPFPREETTPPVTKTNFVIRECPQKNRILAGMEVKAEQGGGLRSDAACFSFETLNAKR